jgi:hypothetical protein
MKNEVKIIGADNNVENYRFILHSSFSTLHSATKRSVL